MSTLTIVEGQGVGKQASGGQQAMGVPFVTAQRVTFTGTAGYSVGTSVNTSIVRLWADAQCSVLPSIAASASVASGTPTIILAANTPEYFSTPLGTPIFFSVIANS